MSFTEHLNNTPFQAGNPEHMKLVKEMGISILTLADGRVQLIHTFTNVSLLYVLHYLCWFVAFLLFGLILLTVFVWTYPNNL